MALYARQSLSAKALRPSAAVTVFAVRRRPAASCEKIAGWRSSPSERLVIAARLSVVRGTRIGFPFSSVAADQAVAAGHDHRVILVVAGPGERQLGQRAHGDALVHDQRLRLGHHLGRLLLVEGEAVRPAGHRVVVLAGDQMGRPATGEDHHAVELAVVLEDAVEVPGDGRAALPRRGGGHQGADRLVEPQAGLCGRCGGGHGNLPDDDK